MALQRLTDTEELIMECVWTAKEPVSFAVIIAAAKERFDKEWKRQTVSTFLSHLVQKGYLKNRRQGKTMFYEPIVTREEYVRKITTGFMRLWYGSCPQALVANLAETEVFSEEELGEIQTFMKELDK